MKMMEMDKKEFNDSKEETLSLSDSDSSQESCVEKSPVKKRNRNKHTYTCMYDDCNKSYSRSSHLRRHEAIHENISYQCTEKGCERIFKTKFTLKKHVDNFHLKKKPKKYKCPDCDQEFNKHSWLTRHQYRHTGVKPFVCSVQGCEKSFPYQSRLKRHLKVHEGYTCTKENCDQKFPTWTMYVKHVKTAHPTIHRCHYCEKVFTRSSNLKAHLEVHELDRKVYLCPKANCSKFYSANRNLEYHLKSYHEKRPFECTINGCFKAFKSEEELKAHTNHHEKRTRRKKKSKAKPTFTQKLAGLVPKKISSSNNSAEHKEGGMLSKDENKNISIPAKLINDHQDEGSGNNEFSSLVESDGKNEDVPCFTISDSTEKDTTYESNLGIKETLLNNKLICPKNSLQCISA